MRSVIRARQPALTRITPHQGNSRYIIPSRKGVPAWPYSLGFGTDGSTSWGWAWPTDQGSIYPEYSPEYGPGVKIHGFRTDSNAANRVRLMFNNPPSVAATCQVFVEGLGEYTFANLTTTSWAITDSTLATFIKNNVDGPQVRIRIVGL